MTGDEFKAAIAALGYTQAAFGFYVDTNKRTVATWAKEGPPHHIVVLLGWMKRTSIDKAPVTGQTQEAAKLAIMPVIGHVIGMAHLAGWDSKLVAEAVVEIAHQYHAANNAVSQIVDPVPPVAKRA